MNDLGTPSHQFTNLYTLIVCLSEELLSEATISLLGADVTITGNISATTELHIDGTVEGDIDCASLVQGDGSQINGCMRQED